MMKIICKQDNCLNEKFNRLWKHHPIEISHEGTSWYDKFIDNIRLEDDRYSVAFSFKENRPVLADNYLFCRNLLQRLKKRLNKTPQLRKKYNDKYLIVGIIEKVKNEGILGYVLYLPHKEVIKKDRLITMLRTVFDATAKYKDTSSLN